MTTVFIFQEGFTKPTKRIIHSNLPVSLGKMSYIAKHAVQYITEPETALLRFDLAFQNRLFH